MLVVCERGVRRLGCAVVLTAMSVAVGCEAGENGSETDGSEETESDGNGSGAQACGERVSYTPGDACAADEVAYRPGADDRYPACSSDDAGYALIADTPSSIARVEAYEDILVILGDSPDIDAFTAARAKYSEEEGLESRLQRRENLWETAVPELSLIHI